MSGSIYYPDDDFCVGEIIYPNGVRYVGVIANDMPNGKGKMCYPSGYTANGFFSNGALNGKGKLFYENGDWSKGKFVNGQLFGKGKILKDNQRLKVIFSSNDAYQLDESKSDAKLDSFVEQFQNMPKEYEEHWKDVLLSMP